MIPADAAGLVDGVASVDAIVGIAGEHTRAVASMGDNVALVTLAEVSAEDEVEADTSAPSK